MAYFDTKEGSLEEAIKAAVKNETNKNDKSDDGEGLDAVQPKAVKKKFTDRKDKDIDNDGDVDSSDKYLHKRRKAISKAVKKEGTWHVASDAKSISKLKTIMQKPIKLGKEGDDATDAISFFIGDDSLYDDLYSAGMKNPNGDARPIIKKHLKRFTKEAFEFGTPEATENSLKVTPGQSTDDWNKQIDVMHQKQSSMRETLAKMWDVEEGHNPFKKEEEKNPKKEGKTMTGKPMTKVEINSKKDT